MVLHYTLHRNVTQQAVISCNEATKQAIVTSTAQYGLMCRLSPRSNGCGTEEVARNEVKGNLGVVERSLFSHCYRMYGAEQLHCKIIFIHVYTSLPQYGKRFPPLEDKCFVGISVRLQIALIL